MIQCDLCKNIVIDFEACVKKQDARRVGDVVEAYVHAIGAGLEHPTHHFQMCDYMRDHSGLLRHIFFVYCTDKFLDEAYKFSLIREQDNMTDHLLKWLDITSDIFSGRIQEINLVKKGEA